MVSSRKARISPFHVLLITTAGIFLAELVAMVVIYLIPALPYVWRTLIDAVIMTALIFPLLYFLSFRELLRYIERQRQNELQLELANRNLQEMSYAERDQRAWAEALTEAVAALTQSLDLEEVLSSILTQIKRAIPYHAAAVLVVDGEKVTILRHRGFGELPEAVTRYEDLGFGWDVFPSLVKVRDTGEPILVRDIETYPLRAGVSGFEWMRSFMVVPLKHENLVVGLIVLLAAESNYFDEVDFERLIRFTDHAEIAITNARLFEGESRARELANVLRNASADLATGVDLDDVVCISLRYLARLVPYDSAEAVILESEDRFVVRAHCSSNGEPVCPPLEPVSSDVANFPRYEALLREQKSLLIADMIAEETALRNDGHGAVGDGARSWLGVPLAVGGKIIGLYSLAKAEPRYFNDEHVHLCEALATQTAVTIQKAWLFEQVRTGSERLQSLSRRLVEIQEEERNFIARELHDEAGQALAALSVDLKVLEQHVAEPEVILSRVARMDGTLQATITNLRRLAMALRPPTLDHLGLEAAVRQHVEDVGERQGLTVQFDCFGSLADLPENVETALYRIVQEALTNTVRHARATRVDVLLKRRGGSLILLVEDDGAGFDPSQAQAGTRLGLLGMRERAEMMGGQLTIESAHGCGTTILVEIPYVDSDPDY